jgi:multimeric flavodoxin WrbA
VSFVRIGLGYQPAVTDQSDASFSALALVCSLKPSPAPSSSQLVAEHLLRELAGSGVTADLIRCVDFDIRPGVEADMGDDDQWPELREKVRAADILVMCTPT